MTGYFARNVRRWRCLALALLDLPGVSFAQVGAGVGFRPITIHDPVNGGTMPGYVFYPSTHAGGVTWAGAYKLHAIRNVPATAIAGARPLVVISHGHGGSDVDLHGVATEK